MSGQREGAIDWPATSVLITGGTGSLGQALVHRLLAHEKPRRVVVFSRDEWKQSEMRARIGADERLRFHLGDVRSLSRLHRAFDGVDVVVHAAAIKQVPAAEENVFECVQTNVLGSQNVVEAAIDCGVGRAMLISSDKASASATLYGSTKHVAERLFVQGNAYAGAHVTRLSCVRYGNVLGSRGSVVHAFRRAREEGQPLSITDPASTRFWWTLDSAVAFVLRCLEVMYGGEVFVPKLRAASVAHIAAAIAPDHPVRVVGLRGGEKLHEVLIAPDEARSAREAEDAYVLTSPWAHGRYGPPVSEGFRYSSDTAECLSRDEITKLLEAST